MVPHLASIQGAFRSCGRDARSAKLLIDQYGEGAAIQAAMTADAMLDEGDLDGAAVWRWIVGAINDIQREHDNFFPYLTA